MRGVRNRHREPGHARGGVPRGALGIALLAVAVYFVGKSRVLPELWFQMLTGTFLLGAAVFAGAFDTLGPESDRRARLRKTAGLLLLVGALVAFFQPILEYRIDLVIPGYPGDHHPGSVLDYNLA